MKIYRIKPDKAVIALRGLCEVVLMAAQAAVVVGGASPRAVVRELNAISSQLTSAGWLDQKRQSIVERPTIHER